MGGVQLGLTAVAAASDEMQVASAIIADEPLGHEVSVWIARRLRM
jgi:hypothetical protein